MAGFGALACNMILRLCLFVITIGLFGVELTKTLVWPVEELSRSVGIATNFLGRLDSVFTALWVTVAFTSILMYYYLSSLTFSRVMKFREQSLTVLPLLPIIFIVSLIPQNLPQVEEISDISALITGSYTFAVPPLLLLVSYIRGTHRKENQGRQRER
jgi:spore germination protein